MNILLYNHHNLTDDLLLVVRKALANFVIRRERLLNFFYPEFERSVKMILGKAGMRKYHQLLANYFAAKGYDYERTIAELPYQLQWGQLYEKALILLSDGEFIETKCQTGMLAGLCQDYVSAEKC